MKDELTPTDRYRARQKAEKLERLLREALRTAAELKPISCGKIYFIVDTLSELISGVYSLALDVMIMFDEQKREDYDENV